MPQSTSTSVGKGRQPEGMRPIASTLRLPSTHVAAIDDSHDRCAAFGLSRFETPDLSPLARSDMVVVRERNTRLFEHAAPVMEMLFEQIETTQSMVLLCDAMGTVLHSIGDDDFLSRASKVALAPGANWSEQSKGTNAVGTALVCEAPTLVHADEHFFHANHFLTCSASPILDPKGRVLGVLDVSGDHRSYHQHTMALVKMSARMIENHWLSDDYRHVMRLHFHDRPEFIGTLNEGILAVTSEGKVVGVNRSALDLLKLSGAAVRMQSIEQLIGLRVGMMVDHFRSPLAAPLTVRTANGQVLYLLARFDWPVWSTLADAVSHVTAPAAPSQTQATNGSTQTSPLKQTKDDVLTDQGSSHATVEASPSAQAQVIDTRVAELIRKAQRVHNRGLPVLVVGESGSDKMSLAKALHAASSRAQGPFVCVRMGALNALQQDQALFGTVAHPGAAWQARGGTLCVADVDELHAQVQVKLQRLLQDGHVVVDDAPQAVPIDLAVVTTTRHDLRDWVAEGRFSKGLHQLLNGLTIKWPALRQRSDVLPLARNMLRDIAGGTPPSLSASVAELIQRAPWPGNQRQLRRLLIASCALAQDEPSIELTHLPEDFLESMRASFNSPLAQSQAELTSLDRFSAQQPSTSKWVASDQGEASATSMVDILFTAIRDTVKACDGNISEAAKRLGISRNTIYRKLRK
jgi:sigma-54 dependent transcriptional regulator, acetoin dehydrogenase operon transcriptional activator AcoR